MHKHIRTAGLMLMLAVLSLGLSGWSAGLRLSGDLAPVRHGTPGHRSAILGLPWSRERGGLESYLARTRRLPGPWIEQAKLTAQNGVAHDAFGAAVALSGNTAIVGAPYANNLSGAVYVFVRDDATWILQQKLLPDNPAPTSSFGYSVAIDGNTAVIGSVHGVSTTGETYVFVREDGIWRQQQVLTFPDGTINDRPAFAVALDHNTLVIGSPFQNYTIGEVFVYARRGPVWLFQARLAPDDRRYGELFGYSVAVAGDTILVGAPRQDGTGAAYVFENRDGARVQQRKLRASDGVIGSSFGDSVALGGDTAVVGADAAYAGKSALGAVYVFTHAQPDWVQQVKLTASDGAPLDAFGNSVALSGHTIVVGAYGKNASAGAAYVFVGNGAEWRQQQELTAADAMPGDTLGVSVSVSGNTALAGADAAFNYPAVQAAYVFVRPEETSGG